MVTPTPTWQQLCERHNRAWERRMRAHVYDHEDWEAADAAWQAAYADLMRFSAANVAANGADDV